MKLKSPSYVLWTLQSSFSYLFCLFFFPPILSYKKFKADYSETYIQDRDRKWDEPMIINKNSSIRDPYDVVQILCSYSLN